jgi:uncharacterized tellurite resistance protein B-like protein
MINTLRHLFDTYLAPDGRADDGASDERTRLAVAALLLEIAESDFADAPEEQREIANLVQAQFDLTPQEAAELIKLAQVAHAESTDYFQFTRLINQDYSMAQKISLVESLWRVAFADHKLHRYEEHVIRRLSDLIHVSHKDFIAAKLRVMNAMG